MPIADGRRLGFSYSRLPEQLLRLSVLKLDGSSFDVDVVRSATVEGLKAAVEGLFDGASKEGEEKISWHHVWSNFCLCYEGHQLTDNKTSLRTLGIKDGDQLHFIRHVSTTYVSARRNGCSVHISKQQSSTTSETRIHQESKETFNDDEEEIHQESKEIFKDDDRSDGNNYEDTSCVNESYQWDPDKEDIFQHSRFRLAHFLRSWLSYTRLWCRVKSRTENKGRLFRYRRYCRKNCTKGNQLVKK